MFCIYHLSVIGDIRKERERFKCLKMYLCTASLRIDFDKSQYRIVEQITNNKIDKQKRL